MNLDFHDQSGYMALISAIIISVLLITISIVLSTSSFFSRFNVADGEYKKRSSNLAEACVDSALGKLAQNSLYAPAPGGDIVSVGSDACTIFSVTTAGGQTTIKTKAAFPASLPQSAVTNLQIIVDSDSFSLISWQELPSL